MLKGEEMSFSELVSTLWQMLLEADATLWLSAFITVIVLLLIVAACHFIFTK